jgi:hypothetical protein
MRSPRHSHTPVEVKKRVQGARSKAWHRQFEVPARVTLCHAAPGYGRLDLILDEREVRGLGRRYLAYSFVPAGG